MGKATARRAGVKGNLASKEGDLQGKRDQYPISQGPPGIQAGNSGASIPISPECPGAMRANLAPGLPAQPEQRRQVALGLGGRPLAHAAAESEEPVAGASTPRAKPLCEHPKAQYTPTMRAGTIGTGRPAADDRRGTRPSGQRPLRRRGRRGQVHRGVARGTGCHRVTWAKVA